MVGASHAVVAMPCMTVPPLGLSAHHAVGTTLFGVAVRHGLLGANWLWESEEPQSNPTAVLCCGLPAFIAARWCAEHSAELSAVALRRLGGGCLLGCAVVLAARKYIPKPPADAVVGTLSDGQKAVCVAAGIAAGCAIGFGGIGMTWALTPAMMALGMPEAVALETALYALTPATVVA